MGDCFGRSLIREIRICTLSPQKRIEIGHILPIFHLLLIVEIVNHQAYQDERNYCQYEHRRDLLGGLHVD
jgi:hypothetical protein